MALAASAPPAHLVAMDRTAAKSSPLEILADGPISRQTIGRFEVETRRPGLVDVTREVSAMIREARGTFGVATVFVRHTSASLTIQENASPEVLDDLVDALDRLAPRNAGWRHDVEGPDDMPAHVKTMLTGASLSIPVLDGRLALGTWQAVYLVEHRDRPHRREILVAFAGS